MRMKKLKNLIAAALCLCTMCMLALPAHALEYNFGAPSGPEYGKATSFEPVVTADGGAMKNEDVSKNAALIPPAFGSPSAYTLNTGFPLTPNLAPGYMPGEGVVISDGIITSAGVGGIGGSTVTPPDLSGIVSGGTAAYPGVSASTVGYTEVTSDMYYSDGSLGVLEIPSLNVKVKVYQGTDSAALAKGAGHFENTSIWSGNVCVAAHNRGVRNDFSQIHTLRSGDVITLTTALGARTYAVTGVNRISVNDTSGLGTSGTDIITLYTCVANQPDYRWCVTAVAVGG